MKSTQKTELIAKHRLHEKDTGSVALQIILLSAEIEKDKLHLASNKKDIPAKRTLLKKIARQKKDWKYLAKHNPTLYQKLQQDLK